MVVVLAGEQRLAREHLEQRAPDGPDVDGLGVRPAREHDLRRAVPARRDVFRELQVAASVPRHAACEPKVADLEVAVRVDEQVAGLDVAVQHARRVDRLEAAQDLVRKVLRMIVAQRLRAHDAVQVRVHHLLHKVHVLVREAVARHDDVQQLDDVLAAAVLVKVAQQAQLTQRAHRQQVVLERRDALDRDARAGAPVHGAEHDAVPALADDRGHLVVPPHILARLADHGRPAVLLARLGLLRQLAQVLDTHARHAVRRDARSVFHSLYSGHTDMLYIVRPLFVPMPPVQRRTQRGPGTHV